MAAFDFTADGIPPLYWEPCDWCPLTFQQPIIPNCKVIFRLESKIAFYQVCKGMWHLVIPTFGLFYYWCPFRKSSKTPSSVSLYNKQNNTWTLGDMEFIFSCSHSISHSFAALTRSISMWTLEDKFHISARPCIILYLVLLKSETVLSSGINY